MSKLQATAEYPLQFALDADFLVIGQRHGEAARFLSGDSQLAGVRIGGDYSQVGRFRSAARAQINEN
jgi:hypothetical protein